MKPNTSTIVFIAALLPSFLNGDDAFHPQRLKLLPQICTNNDNDAIAMIHKMVLTGQTAKARLLANECTLVVNEYTTSSSLLKCCSVSSDIIIEAYKTSKEMLYKKEDYLQSITDNLNKVGSNATIKSAEDSKCAHSETSVSEIEVHPFASNNEGDLYYTHGSTIIEQWNACCSYWRDDSSASKCILDNFCCEIVEGTDHHLILPALREPNIRIRLENREVIEIEQNGLLQLYDVSGVLWPAGYLLGLCLSNPAKCGVEEILYAINNAKQPAILELGTGVGFAAIAISKTVRDQSISPLVFATDVSKSALDLTVTNAYKNGVEELIVAMEADYRDASSLKRLIESTISLSGDNTSKEQQGFEMVIGSSLQSLFDGTQDKNAPLWLTLDTLLSRNNPNAIVILSHVRSGSERIKLPDESIPFELVRRIPGDKFNMKTRDGNISDFELVVLRRRRQS